MKPLGSVVNFSPKGSIVIRADITPRIGQVVCDSKGVPLGKIIRITGPVESPYVLVSPLAKDEMSLFRIGGKKVFLDDSPRQSERREHRARRDGPPRPRDDRRDGPPGPRDDRRSGPPRSRDDRRSGPPRPRDDRRGGRPQNRPDMPRGGGGYKSRTGGPSRQDQGSRPFNKDRKKRDRR